MSNLAALLAAMPDDQRRAALASLSKGDLAALEYAWEVWARPDQLPPDPNLHPIWRTWLLLGGRGSGKTRSSAEATRAEIEAGRRCSIGLIGPTADTLRRDQAAALLQIAPPWFQPVHEASQRRLVYPNGAIAYMLSSEEPDRIRGLNLDFAWGDELTSWANQADVWSNLQLALRVPGPKGHDPAAVISTTPKMQPLLRQIVKAPSTVVTRSKTSDNAANLSAATIEHLQATYGGTTLGRQELDAELLEDLEGALWTRANIDRARIIPGSEPDFKRVVVAVDPAGGNSRQNAETGIIVAARGDDGHGYVLRDASGRHTPEQWGQRAIGLYHEHRADRVIAEQNFGAAMVEAVLRGVDSRVPLKMVVASRGKQIRAEPVASLYEQGRVHHVGVLPELEDQMCGWDPAEVGPSPDRVDALVWALSELMVEKQPRAARRLSLNFMAR